MGRNLGPLNIKDTYEGLVQISSSLQLTDGSGSLIPSVDVTASNATAAQTIDIQSGAGDTDFTVPFFDPASGVGQNSLLAGNNPNFNPSTNTLTAGTFNGNLSGTATSASRADSAANADVAQKVRTNVDTADAERYITYVENANGDYPINVDANLTFNPSTNNLTTDTFTGALVGNADTATSASHAVNADTAISASYATTASFALNVTSPDLQDVTDQGASTTNAIIIDGDSTAQLSIRKSGADNVRFITTDSLNALVLNQVGSQTVKIDFNGTPGEIETTGDLTLDTQGGQVITTDISASGYVSASEFIGDLTGNATSATTSTSASHALNADNAISSSYAVTASFALNVTPIDTGSFMETGSVTDATLTFTKADASTFDLVVNNVVSANTASYVETAQTASYVAGANVDGTVATATSASHAIFADTAGTAADNNAMYTASISDANITFTKGDASSFAIEVNNVNNAVSASYATTASFALNAGASTLQEVINAGNIATGSAYLVGSLVVGNSGSAIPTPNTHNVNLAVKDSITNSGTYGLIAASDNAEITGGETNSIIGGGNARINGGGGQSVTILGSRDVTIGSTQNTNGILCAEFSEIGGSAGIGNTIIAGYNNRINSGGYNFIIAKENNTISSGGGYNAIIGAFGATISAGRDQTIIGGNGQTINSSGNKNTIIGGDNHVISSAAERSVIIGGANLTNTESDNVVVPSLEYTGSFKMGKTNTITGTHGAAIGTTNATIAANEASVIGGDNNTINAGCNSSAIISTDGGTITGALRSGIFAAEFAQVNAQSGVIIGGYGHVVNSPESGCYSGDRNTINSRGAILGGHNHVINGSSDYSVIIAGDANQVSHPRSVVIGGANLSTDRADQVVVPNLKVSGSVTGGLEVTGSVAGEVNVISIASNTGSMDCNLGNNFEITLQNGIDTHLTATNFKAGQNINLKITNNATAAGTLSFQPGVFAFEGGVPFSVTATTNAIDLMAFSSYSPGLLYGSGLNNFITLS